MAPGIDTDPPPTRFGLNVKRTTVGIFFPRGISNVKRFTRSKTRRTLIKYNALHWSLSPIRNYDKHHVMTFFVVLLLAFIRNGQDPTTKS